MARFSTIVKEKLLSVITSLEHRKEEFVKNPGKDFTRERRLSFKDMIGIMLSMGGKTTSDELLEYFHYPDNIVTTSAFIQQRSKILSNVFYVLLHEFNNSFKHYKTFEGYRLLAVDGSDLHIPRNPKDQDTYFQSTPTSIGFNLIHINALYDLLNKLYVDVRVQQSRKVNEFSALTDMISNSQIPGKVLLLGDRGYESYNVIAHAIEKGWKFLIRVKAPESRSILSTFNVPVKGEFDIHIERLLTRSKSKKLQITPGIYKYLHAPTPFDYITETEKIYRLSCRVVKVALEDGSFQYFITNLDVDTFPLEEIRELYHLRWGIETSFRELKHVLALTHLHSKKMEYMIQEVFAKMVIYNYCSLIALTVAIKKKKRKYNYQVNFTRAMTICLRFFKCKKNARPPNVEVLIQKYILPIRAGRTNPRNIKLRAFVSFNYR